MFQVNFLFLTSDALIKVKRAELKRKYKDHPSNLKSEKAEVNDSSDNTAKKNE